MKHLQLRKELVQEKWRIHGYGDEGSEFVFHWQGGVPLRDGSVEEVEVLFPLEELSRAHRMLLLREIRRVLVPGGQLLAADADFPELKELAPFAGLYPVEDAGRDGKPLRGAFAKREKNNEKTPLVSILIAAYKARYFEEALRSALNQTYPNIEVVVCDDSPDEKIAEIVQQFAGDKRLRYYRNPENLGARKNYLQCFEKARGEYIKFLNDDDMLHPRCVERMAHYLTELPDVTLVTSYRLLIDEWGRPLPDQPFNRPIVPEDRLIYGTSLANAMLSKRINFIGEPTTVMFRKRDLMGTQPHIFSYNGHPALANGDVTMWTNLLGRGEAVYLREAHSFFRQHGEQVQQQSNFKERGDKAWEVIARDAREMGFLQEEEEEAYDRIVTRPIPEAVRLPQLSASRKRLEKKTAAVPAQVNKSDSNIVVSIVIPVFNQVEYTRRCLESIWQNTDNSIPYEIIVVDNASTDGTEEFLQSVQAQHPHLRVVRNRENLGFSRACNQGAEVARGQYLLFLNNDTEPQPGWLPALLEPFREKNVGVVGAKLLYPDGTVQHAGIEMLTAPRATYLDGYGATLVLPEQPYRFVAENDERVNRKRELDMVTGACLMMPAALFRKVAGFDPAYRNGGEDIDLCLKVRAEGYRVVYQPEAVVIHYEGRTVSRFDYVKENTERFFQHWGWTFNDDWRFEPDFLPLKKLSHPATRQEFLEDASRKITHAPQEFNKLRHEVKLLREKKQTGKIRELFQQFLRKYPTYVVAHNELGVFYLQQNDLPRALHHLQIAHYLEPENIVIMENLAEVYRLVKLQEYAKVIYRTILELEPERLSALLSLSKIFMDQKNWKKALTLLNKAHSLAHQNEKILNWILEVRQHIEEEENRGSEKGRGKTRIQKIACPFCGSKKAVPFRSVADIVKCQECGTVYLRTRPDPEELRKMYDDYAKEGSHMQLPRNREEVEQSPLQRREFLDEILEFIQPEGKILDVGCGWGAFLHNARKKGFDPVGIEITPDSVKFANQQLKIPVYSNPIESLDWKPESLSVVTMLHVLEHLPYPREALQKVYALLKPGGMFCGIVPNISSFLSDQLMDKWEWLDPNFHYLHFSPEVLKARLEEAGFVVERMYTTAGDMGEEAVRKRIQEIFGTETGDFSEEIKRYLEENGYGEEIRFFARKPETLFRAEEDKDTSVQTAKETGAVAGSAISPTPAATHLKDISRHSGNKVDVSIIIPLYNQVEYTRKCLKAIYQNTCADISFEIIFVDNASHDETPQFLEEAAARYPNVRYIRNEVNRFYAGACNQGAKLARGRYLVFLNNDTEPQPGWLKAALERFQQEKDVGIVGVKLLYPDGTIQHCGIEFMENAHPDYKIWPLHRYLKKPADYPPANRPEEVTAVTGACLFIPRKLFKRVHGFSEEYRMYFEDTDLCFKVRREGYRIFYEPRSVVIHYEGQSTGDRQSIDEMNTRAATIFYKKWWREIERMEFQQMVAYQEGKFYFLREDILPEKYEEGDVTLTGLKLGELFSKLDPFYVHIGGAGDALLLLAQFYEKDSVDTIVSVANSIGALKSFFSAFPKIKKVYFIPRPRNDISQALLRKVFANLPNCRGMGVAPESEFYEDEWNESLDIFTRYKITKRPAWLRMFRKQKLTNPQVVIQPKGSLKGMVGSKQNIINQRYWIPMLKMFQELGIRPILIGTPDERKMYPAFFNVLDKRSYSFREQMELIVSSDLFIGADSWGKTLSALAGIPTIVFHSVVGKDLEGWKDASDYVFLDPWEEIVVVENFQEFQMAFQEAREMMKHPHKKVVWKVKQQLAELRANQTKREALYLWREGGIGDILMSFPLVRALKEKHPEKEIVYVTAEKNIPLVQASPYVDRVISSRQLPQLEKDGIPVRNLNLAKFGISSAHQVDMFLQEFNLTVPGEKKNISLDVPPEAEQKVQGLLQNRLTEEQRKRPLVLIHPARGDANRTWPEAFWKQFIEWLLGQGVTVVLTGNTSHDPERGVHQFRLPGLVNLVNELSPLEFVALCRQGELLITTDSGPVQLAAASDIAIVGIYTVVPGKNRLPYRHGVPGWNALSIEPECPFAGCYLYMNQPTYAREINRQLRNGQISQKELFSTWCLNDDKYACLQKWITPEKVQHALQPILDKLQHSQFRQIDSREPLIHHSTETVTEKISFLIRQNQTKIVAENPEVQLEHLRREIQADPRKRSRWQEYFQQLKRRGNVAQLLDAYRQYLSVYPEDAEVLNEMGVLLWNNGRRKEAVTFLEHALLNNRQHPEYLKNLAEAYLTLENFQDAIKVLMEMMRLFPEDFYAFQVMAELYVENGDLQSALKLVEQFLVHNPEHPQALQMRELLQNRPLFEAYRLIQMGDTEQALPILQKFLSENPENVQARTALGSILFQKNELEKAETVFRSVLKKCPGNTDALLYLSQIYLQTGREKEMEALVNRHREFFHQDAVLLTALIEWEISRGSLTGAVQEAEAFLQEHPENTEMWLLLGDLYNRMGNGMAASRAYQQVLEREPQHPEAKARLEQLENIPV